MKRTFKFEQVLQLEDKLERLLDQKTASFDVESTHKLSDRIRELSADYRRLTGKHYVRLSERQEPSYPGI